MEVVALEESSPHSQNSDLFAANNVVYATATLPPLPVHSNVQTTNNGLETPVPTENDFFRNLQEASRPQKANRDLILDAIHVAVDSADPTSPEGKPKPSNTTISEMTKLLAVVPDSLLGTPEVSVYHGEVHVEWERGIKRLVLMAFSKDKQPLVHNYEKAKGKPSKHGTEKATATSLEKWLRWLNG
jgi:hypothetical protein